MNSSFRNDVGVQTVAKVNRIDVITVVNIILVNCNFKETKWELPSEAL